MNKARIFSLRIIAFRLFLGGPARRRLDWRKCLKKPEIRLKLLMQCVNAILALPLPAAGLNILYKRKEKNVKG